MAFAIGEYVFYIGKHMVFGFLSLIFAYFV